MRVQTQKPSKDPEKKKGSTECEETLTHNKPTKQEEHADLNASGGVHKEQVELMRVTRVKGGYGEDTRGERNLLERLTLKLKCVHFLEISVHYG